MFRPVLATLGYVLSADGRQVLLIYRNQRPSDPHYGKYNGLGGKLEPDEDIVACLYREINEEAGIECSEARLRGTVSWPGFGTDGCDWFGFIFLVTAWRGQVQTENQEGSLVWVDLARLPDLPMWEGDRHFLPLVFGDRSQIFHGVMPYEGGRPVSWHYHLVKNGV
jgi:8-oxo-dGTP diphosphatase